MVAILCYCVSYKKWSVQESIVVINLQSYVSLVAEIYLQLPKVSFSRVSNLTAELTFFNFS